MPILNMIEIRQSNKRLEITCPMLDNLKRGDS